MPLFDYEREIYDLLQVQKYIWIVKSVGLGITELFIRYICWRCLVNSEWKNGRICVVTGPRIELAITLIDRMKRLFDTTGLRFDDKQTVLELNGAKIEAYPSHHIDAIRGLTDVKLILLDEASFFPIGQQRLLRDAVERYIAKSSPIIAWVSTPGSPDDVFAQIGKES